MDEGDQIDELICRYFNGYASDAEGAALKAWRQASPENEARYRELHWLLRLAETTSLADVSREGLPAHLPSPIEDPRRVSGRMLRSLRGRAFGLDAPPRRRLVWWVGGAAAAAGIIAAVLIGMERPGPAVRGPIGEAVTSEVLTTNQEMSTVRLRDGSIVRLAPGSRLGLAEGNTGREITLQGRAYFAVAKAAGRPFRIHASAYDVTVLGTRFELQAHGDDLRLIVVEGKVALDAPGGRTLVEGGQMVRVVDGHMLPVVRIPDMRDSTRWVGRFLAFQNTPLKAVIADIEALYDVRATVTDSALFARTVTAWFVDRDVDQVVDIVCGVMAIACVIEGRNVRIAPSAVP